jgi:hypothetical protein
MEPITLCTGQLIDHPVIKIRQPWGKCMKLDGSSRPSLRCQARTFEYRTIPSAHGQFTGSPSPAHRDRCQHGVIGVTYLANIERIPDGFVNPDSSIGATEARKILAYPPQEGRAAADYRPDPTAAQKRGPHRVVTYKAPNPGSLISQPKNGSGRSMLWRIPIPVFEHSRNRRSLRFSLFELFFQPLEPPVNPRPTGLGCGILGCDAY